MKVQIISIKLDVLDSSTKTENDFLIGDYIVDYEVWFPPLKHTHITGQLLIKLYPVDDNAHFLRAGQRAVR